MTSGLNRRQFLRSAAAAGISLAVADRLLAQAGEQAAPAATTTPAPAGPALRVALVGAGSQGSNLMLNCLKIPGVQFAAVCDVWPYHQELAVKRLKKFDQAPAVYDDYRQMLDKEKSLDAVIIATPDWVHAEQAIDCMQAGKHVYCEKEMAHTVDGARKMVQASRSTKKLLQIGHQRRSNPRYKLGEKLIHNDKMLGRVTHVYGQWNRSRCLSLGWPKDAGLDDATLKKHGYDSMEQFRNWRWYRKFSGGPMVDLGSHQVDVFNWLLKATPASVFASGGADYPEYKGHEWYDNVIAVYEYNTTFGKVRGVYQVLNTTSFGDFYEVIMGDEGSLQISEDTRKGFIFREPEARKKEWENEAKKVDAQGREAITLAVGQTLDPSGRPTAKAQALAAEAAKPVHQLHLENFFDAIRTGAALNCPGELSFESAVSVIAANESVAAGKKIEFKPEDFKA
jgi:predicted dehydrogenase